MDKINVLLEQLKNLYKQKYEQNLSVEDEIQKIERKIIHPDDGAYFTIAMRLKNSKDKKWRLLTYSLFESKEVAQRRLKECIATHKNIGNIDDVEIKIIRASVFETDITNVL